MSSPAINCLYKLKESKDMFVYNLSLISRLVRKVTFHLIKR